ELVDSAGLSFHDQPNLTAREVVGRVFVQGLTPSDPPPDDFLYGLLAPILRGGEEASVRRSAATREAGARASRGEDFEAIPKAFVGAFSSWNDLDALVRSALEVRLDTITVGTSLERAILDLIRWAESRGDLDRLIEAASRARPDDTNLSKLLAQLQGPRPGNLPAEAIRLRRSQVEKLAAVLADAFPGPSAFADLVRYRTDQVVIPEGSAAADLAALVRTTVDRANDEGWMGPLLAAAREANPTHPRLYQFAEDFGLTAARPEDDRRVRETLPDLDIDAWRARLGELEGQV